MDSVGRVFVLPAQPIRSLTAHHLLSLPEAYHSFTCASRPLCLLFHKLHNFPHLVHHAPSGRSALSAAISAVPSPAPAAAGEGPAIEAASGRASVRSVRRACALRPSASPHTSGAKTSIAIDTLPKIPAAMPAPSWTRRTMYPSLGCS